MLRILTFTFLLLWIGCNKTESENLLGDDIRLFKNVSWSLAKAVEQEDTVRINQILSRRRINVDEREKTFGMTLLIWATNERKYNSMKALLKNGADPNLNALYSGTSAIISASYDFETSRYLELVLKYGGDPNNKRLSDGVNVFYSPLDAAAMCNLENVKILIEAGADVNQKTIGNETALTSAIRFKQEDIAKYLLIEQEADYNYPIPLVMKRDTLYITDLLRKWTFPLDSKEHKTKMEIVDFLQERGMDYWETEIPNRYKRKYSQEYLEKY